ncbi:50S ribosomal protein L20 [Aureimonas frigidaquae]|uniref:50S ribosomal protein L20 n=1 Tax=Aureimonas frigidaquae TaxID=424757 RepID=UPI0007817DB4|nr:50S ribosomal protein L20 [Aureimonas frigidaquae]
MARVKRGVTSHAKHKKVLKAAKGFYGRRKNTIRAAKAAVDRAMQYATRDRRNKKRNFRALWIQRINAGVREHGLTYARFMDGLNKAGIEVDRKVLSDIAIHEPEAFAALVAQAKDALAYLKDENANAYERAVGEKRAA